MLLDFIFCVRHRDVKGHSIEVIIVCQIIEILLFAYHLFDRGVTYMKTINYKDIQSYIMFISNPFLLKEHCL